MKLRASLLLLLLSFFALAGCSSEAQRYEDISDLASAVDSAGVECDRIEAGPDARLVRDSGACARSEVELFLFENPQNLADWSKVGTRLGPTLVGSNWAVTGGVADLDRIKSEVGGHIVSTDR